MKQKAAISGSIGLLTSVVIAILALVRGPLETVLLIGTFVVWGLWLLWTQVQRKEERAENFNRQMAQTLLHHVNYRVSACLKAGYPNARWEWMMPDPALFVAQGGTGRIRVYGIAGYEFADVTLDQSGKLSCSLVSLASVQDAAKKPAPPDKQEFDPQVWYDANARQTLERLVADLDSRGHSSLTLKEDGSICTCPKGDGTEAKHGLLADFPAKDCWQKLVEVLERAGLSAAVQDGCIAVTW